MSAERLFGSGLFDLAVEGDAFAILCKFDRGGLSRIDVPCREMIEKVAESEKPQFYQCLFLRVDETKMFCDEVGGMHRSFFHTIHHTQ